MSMLTSLVLAAALNASSPPPPDVQVVTRADVEKSVEGMFRGSWTPREKLAFSASVVAHVADLALSMKSDERCVENNPLLGSSPSNGALVAVKVGAIAFEYWVQSQDFEYSWVYSAASAAIVGAVAVSNSRNDCYD